MTVFDEQQYIDTDIDFPSSLSCKATKDTTRCILTTTNKYRLHSQYTTIIRRGVKN